MQCGPLIILYLISDPDSEDLTQVIKKMIFKGGYGIISHKIIKSYLIDTFTRPSCRAGIRIQSAQIKAAFGAHLSLKYFNKTGFS